MSTTGALLAAARNLTDRNIDELGDRMDDEFVGSHGATRAVLRALRELGRGNTGRPPADLDPLDDEPGER